MIGEAMIFMNDVQGKRKIPEKLKMSETQNQNQIVEARCVAQLELSRDMA